MWIKNSWMYLLEEDHLIPLILMYRFYNIFIHRRCNNFSDNATQVGAGGCHMGQIKQEVFLVVDQNSGAIQNQYQYVTIAIKQEMQLILEI